MDSRFILDPDYIRVEIYEEKYLDSKEEIKQEEIEYMIAHEVTHGLLAYKENYCQVRPRDIDNELVNGSASLLFSMIEDIVVSKIIYENSFQMYPQNLIIMIQNEIEYERKGGDFYKQFNEIKDRYRVVRYVQAWGILRYRYINLDEIGKKTIDEYLIFQKLHPKQYEEAEKIKKIILENNIFVSEGYNNAIKECLDLWNLTDLVWFYTC